MSVSADRYSVPAVQRAIDILNILSAGPQTFTQIQRRMMIPKSSAFAILTTLHKRGLVEWDAEDRYALGMALFSFGCSVMSRFDYRSASLPFMEEIVQKTRETCHLGILHNWQVLYVEKVESPLSIKLASRIGLSLPAHSTGLGKALLSTFTDEQLDAILGCLELARRTDHTITTARELMEDLRLTRLRGFAVDNVENEAGVRCAAAPIRDYSGKAVAALSISGPDTRVTLDRIPELGQLVKETCERISLRLGYQAARPDQSR